MHISAKDKSTGKENKITIKSNSGLSDAEIQAMIKDAELNAEADKKARELIDVKNSAEAQMHEVKKDLEEFRSELADAEITELETVIKEVEDAVNSDDKEKITEASDGIRQGRFAINPKIIEEIIEKFSLCYDRFVIDEFLAYEIQTKYPCYGIHPHLAWQTTGFSDIQNANVDYGFLK
jgi:hypothetical protein